MKARIVGFVVLACLALGAHAYSPPQMYASDLLGMDVLGAMGQDLGEVEELVIDRRTGQVLYAILAFGGLLGMWDEQRIVRFDEIVAGMYEENLVVSASREAVDLNRVVIDWTQPLVRASDLLERSDVRDLVVDLEHGTVVEVLGARGSRSFLSLLQ